MWDVLGSLFVFSWVWRKDGCNCLDPARVADRAKNASTKSSDETPEKRASRGLGSKGVDSPPKRAESRNNNRSASAEGARSSVGTAPQRTRIAASTPEVANRALGQRRAPALAADGRPSASSAVSNMRRSRDDIIQAAVSGGPARPRPDAPPPPLGVQAPPPPLGVYPPSAGISHGARQSRGGQRRTARLVDEDSDDECWWWEAK